MKKLFTLLTMLVACSTASMATGKTIYLKAVSAWAADEAKFAAYTWGGTSEAMWTEMTAVADDNDTYSATLPDGCTSLILGRFAPGATEYSFDDTKGFWNQSVDLTLNEDVNQYTFTGWSDGKGTFVEGIYSPINTYTVTFNNGAGWAHVYAYAWSGENGSEGEQLGVFPGTEIAASDGVYTVTVKATAAPEKILFHNGKSDAAQKKTNDLDFVNGQAYSYTINLPGTEIWSSATPVTAAWYADPYDVKIDKSKFASVNVGDIIHVAVVNLPDGFTNPWDAQVEMKDGYWTAVEGTVNVGNYSVEDATFTITGDMLKRFKERGMIIGGNNFSTNKVSVETGTYTGTENSIWVGQEALNWTQVRIHNSHFKNADLQAGQFIKFSFTGDSPNIQTLYGWGEGENYGSPNYGKGIAYYKIKDSDLEHLKNTDNAAGSTEYIINADGITLTQVEIIDQPDYYILADKGTGWVVDSKMTKSEGTFSGSVNGANYFLLAPAFALKEEMTAIDEWNFLERPKTAEGDFLVNLQNYADETGGSAAWKVANDVDAVNITFTPASNNYALTCEAEVEIGETGYATYSNDNMYKVEGATANFVNVSGSTATLVPQASDAVLPAMSGAGKGAGIILSGEKKSKATIKSVSYDATAVDASDNLMAGSGDAEYTISGKFSDEDSYTGYIFANGSNGVGFYPVSASNTLDAHKAFLAVPGTYVREFIGFNLDNTTAINGIEAARANGQTVYNLAGQRIATPTKGMYIINGKKVIVK